MELPRQGPPPPIEPKGLFTGVQFRPIIIGAVVDYVGTSIAVILYTMFFYMGDALDSGMSEEAVEKAFEKMVASPEALLTLFLIGMLGTVLGGYVAGRLARVEEVKHGALVGAVALIVALVQASVSEPSPVPEWYNILGYILAIPAGALGGSIAQGKGKPPIVDATAGSRGPRF
ncbi:MAG TPA: TIGR04086 family membrane protein [Candidatus Acidoferrales bacterium]|nr:TIGR04086 family membrane protein [Candidatus Acidoferrales bacterium]